MPSSYAHHRFGRELLPVLPPEVRQCIQRFRRMYDLGLQGPDFFFYYNPYFKTAIGELGKVYHRKTGQDFFPAACAAATSEAAKAYLYGLLGHYCLDSRCHPFVEQLAAIGEARHTPLESELERYLLLLDGEPAPERYDISKRFHLTRGECMTVAAFYPPATGGAVSHSIRSMASSLRFLASPKRSRNVSILKKVKPSLIEHMIPAQDDPALAPYVGELKTLYDTALQQYPLLLSQLLEHMKNGQPLGEDFSRNFG